jgi:adenylate cyclase
MSKEPNVTRKLRAILSADVKGYSLLMADDEVHTIETLKKYRSLMYNLVQEKSGRVVDNPGDNLLAEFSSSVDAVEAAVQIQNRLKKENAKFVEDKRLQFRIGVNIGDVVHDGDRIYGSGVNVAARIEGIADAGGICISRNTYDHVKGKIDLGFEYIGEHLVKNIKEPVRVYKVLMDTEVLKPLVREELALPDKPSIAVLPFTNMSGDPDQEYFSDGLTEQIINGLCKISNLFVIARNSSFAYKGKAVSVKQIAKELGVQYILEGSVQKAGNRVRITAKLIEAVSDFHMWSENYDRDLEDIFALQDEITMKLIDVMQVKLTYGQQAHLWQGRTVNIHAYDKWMRGVDHFYKFNREDNAQARSLFIQSTKNDSDYEMPYVMIGYTYIIDLLFGWCESPLIAFEQIEKQIQVALSLTDNLDITYSLLGFLNLYKRQFVEAKKAGERSVELNPNGAEVHALFGFILSFIDETKQAILFIKRALRLDPIPRSHFYFFLGIAYRNDEQYEKSIEICKKAIALDPSTLPSYFTMVCALGCLNRDKEARKYAREILRLDPNFSLNYHKNTIPFQDPSKTEILINALRKAGLPD